MYTKGPWGLGQISPQYNEIGAYQVAIVQKDDTPDQIIPGFAFGRTKEQCIANAKLIAAAPELLEALDFIVNDLKAPGEDAHLSIKGYNKACAAIKKATT